MTASFDPLLGDLSELDSSVLLISASAGTGKTWTIAHLATRWLLEDPEHDPSQLLMVTFSRAAARELKTRLRSRVAEVGELLAGTSSNGATDAWSATLLDPMITSPDERAKLLKRQAEVLARLDEVNARTIHSFAAMVGGLSSRTPMSGSSLYERAVNETLTRLVLQEPAVMEELLEEGPSLNTLQERIRSTAASVAGLGGLPRGTDATELVQLRLAATGIEGSRQLLRELVQETEDRVATTMHLDAITTFDQLIAEVYAGTLDAVGTASSSLRTAYRFVLIDEFQDTDAAQWAIFKEAFVGHVPVIAVGDPKQAIYGFRGGDVVIFQRLLREAQAGTGAYRRAELTTNFRSTPQLVASVNALFTLAEDKGVDDRLSTMTIGSAGSTITLARQWGFSSTLDSIANEVEPIRYQPVIAGVSDQSGSGLEVRDLTQEIGLLSTEPGELHYDFSSTSGAPAGEVRRSVITDLVGVVSRHLEDGVAPEQIAVLARTNGVAKEVLSSLRQGGIKAVQTRTEPVFTSRAAEELRVLFWVLAEPTNPRRTGMLVFTWFRYHEADQIPGLAQALEAFGPGSLSRRLMNRATIGCVLSDGFPERSWTDLDHLLDLLGAAFPSGVTPTLALAWLEEQMSLPEVDEAGVDASARRVESDGGSVVVTTIHASKGLEFDVVLLPEIEPSPRGKDKAPQRGIVSLPDGRLVDFGRLSAKSVGDQSELSLDEERQRTDETARLIYVALTRAKKSLIVWISDLNHHGYPKEKNSNRQRISKTSLWRLLVESSRIAERDSIEAAAQCCESAGAPFATSLPLVQVNTGALIDRGHLPVEASVRLDLEGIVDPPAIDELLRRWSYTEIHLGDVHGQSTSTPDLPDGEVTGAMAGALAEDTYGEGELEEAATSDAFERRGGADIGIALHAVLEDLLRSREGRTEVNISDLVVQRFNEQGITFMNPDRVVEEFLQILRHPLGEAFQHLSLFDLRSSPAASTVSEMRFTLPLGGEGLVVDRVVELSEAVVAGDPEGPYVEFFRGIAQAPAERGRLFHGFLNGSIDLVARIGTENRRFNIVDYKSNQMKRASSFAPDGLAAEMALAGYPLQGLLYMVALHRYLGRRLPDYLPKTHLGSICYFYVRGAVGPHVRPGDGLATWDIPSDVVVEVSKILAGQGRQR